MEKTLEKGKTLLINGPASVTLMGGEVSALGFNLPLRKKVVVRKNKAVPFEAVENSTLEIFLSGDAGIGEVNGSTIPDSWKTMAEAVLKLPKPCTVLVLGDVDSGKNTFCLFLVNRSLAYGLKPAIIDADIGQSEVGPPTTIGLTVVSEPTLDFFSLSPEDVFFVGLTSPSGATRRVIDGLTHLKKFVSEASVQLTVVNTDGWIKEEAAAHYKIELIRALNPEAIVAIQNADELEPLLAAIEESKIFQVAPPLMTRKRDRETRKALREQSYKKFLEGATARSLPMSWVQFELTSFGNDTSPFSNRLRELEEVLGYKISYCEENPQELLVMVDDVGVLDMERVAKAEKSFEKTIRVIREEDLQGLLLGLLDDKRKFLGLGVINKIDCKNKVLKIVTPCRGRISIVQFGQVRIDKLGREIGYTSNFSDYIPR